MKALASALSDTLGEAPLIALAGGIAAGALIAALLPRTEAETRAIRPTARRVKKARAPRYERREGHGRASGSTSSASTATRARRRSATSSTGVTDAAKASAKAALDAARKTD